MRLLRRYVLVATALIGGAMLMAACGGGEEDEAETLRTATPAEEAAAGEGVAAPGPENSLEEYFQQLEEIGEAHFAALTTLEEQSEGVWEDVDATRDYFDGFRSILGQTLADLRDLPPPAEASDAHEEGIAAFSEDLAIWENISDQLADVESVADLEALLEEMRPQWAATAQRFTDACRLLQGIADNNGIEVDLACE